MVIYRNTSNVTEKITAVLSGNGIVIMPCDTIYGIVGAAPGTEEVLRDIKGRHASKQFIQLIGTTEMAAEAASQEIEEKVLALWPGPLTLILSIEGGGTAAVRVPEDPFLRDILKKLSKPVYSTSVNSSGSPFLWRINDIINEFEKRVDLIVNAGDLPGREPSTILDITEKPYRLVRSGALKIPPGIPYIS